MAVTTIVLFIFLLLVCPNTTNGADHKVEKRDVAPHCGVFGPDQEQQQRVQLVGKRGQKGEPSAIDYGKINKKIEKRLESREFNEKIQSMIDKKLDEVLPAVDYVTINARIDEKLDAAMRKLNTTLNAKLLQLETTFTNSFDNPRKEISNNSALDGRTLCRGRGGDVAGILSSDHYALVTSYIRSMIPERGSHINIWLGMTINPQTSVVSLLDGESTPYVSWYSGYPHPWSSWTHIFILVKRVASDENQGMRNYLPLNTPNGVLCKI